MAPHTTLKIGGTAQKAYFPSSVDELIELIKELKANDTPITVIGAGSNLLISSNGIKGAVIFTKNIAHFKVDENFITVGSGMKSVMLSKLAQENNISGLEFLVGIPGSIGGAVTMNSSAHGQAIKDVIISTRVLDLQNNEIIKLEKEDLELEYRSSFVKANKHIILDSKFELQNSAPHEIQDLMDFHINYRAKNHPPLTEPSAGSTFRNPEQGAYVGKMFQELGLKGYKSGEAKISEKHANFIINTGNASSLDVSRLMHKMHSMVKKNYEYDLMAEIRFIGEMTREEEEIWQNFQVH